MSSLYIHSEAVHNFSAAHEVLPLLFEIYPCKSILDVGCGIGTWVKVAKDLGINDAVGIDGDHVDRNLLKIDANSFIPVDLNFPIDLGKRFDAELCLEVAEHLSIESSKVLVETLINHSDVIIFSAAIPGQQGQNHLNEQWPPYWQEKFNRHNYEMIDYFRPLIWDNENIEYWYRQNLFLVVNRSHELYMRLDIRPPLSLVHPELLKLLITDHQYKIQKLNNTISRLSSRDLIGRILRIFR